MQVYPGILTESHRECSQQLAWLQSQPSVSVVHLDIIDGQFVENVTVSPLDVATMDFGELQVDFHLMVEEPMDYVFELEAIKSQVPVRSVIAQVERMSSQSSYLEEVKVNQWRAGLSLDIHTPIEAIDDVAWEWLDVVQLMAIETGFSGQKFNPHVITKIAELQTMIRHSGRTIEIQIDGGINPRHLTELQHIKVDGAVATSFIWASSDKTTALHELVAAG